MSIDEAIKHSEEVAIEQNKLCKRYDDASGYSRSHNEAIRTTDAKRCEECAAEHRQLVEWLKELKAHREAWEKCIKEIKEWYWNADKQAIAKDPCVVDAMVDLFIRTIEECRPKEGDAE